jgi:hypothetical protein
MKHWQEKILANLVIKGVWWILIWQFDSYNSPSG